MTDLARSNLPYSAFKRMSLELQWSRRGRKQVTSWFESDFRGLPDEQLRD